MSKGAALNIADVADSSNLDDEFAAITAVISNKSSTRRMEGVVVVMGEASESEEEIDQETTPIKRADNIDSKRNHLMLPLDTSHVVVKDISKLKSPEQEPIKYNTLLHKKLREKNQLLKKHMQELVYQPFNTTTKELNCITQQLLKLQVMVQEVVPVMRQLTNEAFHLEDKVGMCLESGKSLPNINISTETSFLYL